MTVTAGIYQMMIICLSLTNSVSWFHCDKCPLIIWTVTVLFIMFLNARNPNRRQSFMVSWHCLKTLPWRLLTSKLPLSRYDQPTVVLRCEIWGQNLECGCTHHSARNYCWPVIMVAICLLNWLKRLHQLDVRLLTNFTTYFAMALKAL